MKGYCFECDGRIELVGLEEVGYWWVHEFHPEDGHEAVPGVI